MASSSERRQELRSMLSNFAMQNMEGTADEVRQSGGAKVADCLVSAIEVVKSGGQSSQAAQEVVDVCWEKLSNGGGWPNVGWREAYVFALMVVAWVRIETGGETDEEVLSTKKCMRDLDMALIMGGSGANEIVHSLVECIEPLLLAKAAEDGAPLSDEACEISSEMPPNSPAVNPEFAVERVSNISFADFKKKYFKTDTAVIITGALDSWPARERWGDLRYLQSNFGHRTVPVELGRLENGRKAEGWREEAILMQDLILKHLIPSNRRQIASENAALEADGSGREVAYLAQHLLFDQIPKLAADIAVPEYCECGDFSGANAWLGTAGTVTPLHHDSQDNFLAQVVGWKYVVLYDHLQTRYLYVPRGQQDGISVQGNISPVNCEAPDYEAYPLLREAKHKEALLGPGDMLFIPARHWHYVRSLSPSFSVNFWF